MKYTVEFSPAALKDIKRLLRYIARKSTKSIAEGYLSRITQTCRSLETSPLRGTARPDLSPDVRTIGFERRVTIVFRVLHHQQLVIIEGIFYAGRSVEKRYSKSLNPHE